MPRHTSEEKSGTRFLRMMLLVCVFIGVGWLYSRHFDNALQEIKTRSSVADATGLLSNEQKRQYREFAALFREEFGVELVLRVSDGPVEVPPLKSKSLFFGLDVKNQTLLVEYPVWMRHALGDAFIRELSEEHMTPYFASDSWPTGLMTAMKLVWDRMMNLERTGEVN